MIPLFVFVTCMVGVFGAYFLATRGSEAKRRRLQQRLSDALLYTKHANDEEIQLARQELMSEIPGLSRVLMRMQLATRLRRMLDQADLHITVSRLLMLSLMAGMLAAVAVSVVSISQLLMVVAGLLSPGAPLLPPPLQHKKRLQTLPQTTPPPPPTHKPPPPGAPRLPPS